MNLKNNPELIPLIDWWEKDGKQLVIYLVVAAIAVGGWYGWKNHARSVKEAASNAVVNAYTTEEIEGAVAEFSGTASEGALKLRLAKNYFDAGRYEEALAQYEQLVGKAPDGFADIPVVGKAQALEALGKYAEAQKQFDAFAEANPTNYLTLSAQLGAARCLAAAGDKKGALARLEKLAKANAEDAVAKARVESIESLVKRYDPKAAKRAAKLVEKPAAAKPALKPAEAKSAAKPAEAKPAEKPASAPAAKPAEKKAAK